MNRSILAFAECPVLPVYYALLKRHIVRQFVVQVGVGLVEVEFKGVETPGVQSTAVVRVGFVQKSDLAGDGLPLRAGELTDAQWALAHGSDERNHREPKASRE